MLVEDFSFSTYNYINILINISFVRCAGAGDCCWNGVRGKHCWLAGGWRLLLEWCERKTLLAGAGA